MWRQAEGYSRRQLSFFAAAEDSKPASVPRRTVASLNLKLKRPYITCETDTGHFRKPWLLAVFLSNQKP